MTANVIAKPQQYHRADVVVAGIVMHNEYHCNARARQDQAGQLRTTMSKLLLISLNLPIEGTHYKLAFVALNLNRTCISQRKKRRKFPTFRQHVVCVPFLQMRIRKIPFLIMGMDG